MSLLKRLAHGLGRREESEEPAPAAQSREPSFNQGQPNREVHAYRPAGHEEFAKRPVQRTAPEAGHRPAAGALDPMGRQPAQPRITDDDQLEIPAFLRRQAN